MFKCSENFGIPKHLQNLNVTDIDKNNFTVKILGPSYDTKIINYLPEKVI